MKKIAFACTLALGLLFFFSFQLQAGKPFEGVITYKITYPDSKLSESQMAMFPKLITVAVKGTKSRTEMQMGSMSTVTITDHNDKSLVALMNIMGQKYAIKKTAQEIEKESMAEGKATVELTSETKVIAGYTCKKAIVTVNDDGVKNNFEVFYTNEIGSKMANFDKAWYKDIDGTMLEFTMVSREISMRFTATSVEKKGLSDKDFEIPSDYTLTTTEELKSKFGGGTE